MKIFLIRLKNIILNLGSFSIIVFLFFIIKSLAKKRETEIKKIAWFGAYGNGNLGDDLIFYSLKRLLKKKNFDISLSIRDIKKTKNYGVPIFTKGEQFYDFGKYLNSIKNADAVFLGGGGLLEYYYPSKQAYRMLMIYLCPLMIARIYGKPTFILGMGVNKGKIDNSLVRFVYKHVLSECSFIITRDKKSKEGLIENGVKTTIFSSFDPVLSLDLPSTKKERKKPKIGFLLWPYFLWPHFYENSEVIDFKKQTAHNNFVKRIKALINDLKDEYELEFLTFHFSDTLLYKELGVEYQEKAKLDTFIKKVSSLDLLVSMRYHGQITGFLTETPVVSISVQQKMDALMTNYQFDHYNNSIYNFSETKVLKDIDEIFSNKNKVVNEIILKNKFVGDKIKEIYSALDFNSY